MKGLSDALRKWRGRGEMPSFDAIVEKAFSDGYLAGRHDEMEDWARIQAEAAAREAAQALSDLQPKP